MCQVCCRYQQSWPSNPICLVSSVLLMSSLLGYSFLVTKLFRLSVYFMRCLPLLFVPQIFPLNICFSSPSALFVYPKNCSCLFLMVLSRDLLYHALSITSSFDLFSVQGTFNTWYICEMSNSKWDKNCMYRSALYQDFNYFKIFSTWNPRADAIKFYYDYNPDFLIAPWVS